MKTTLFELTKDADGYFHCRVEVATEHYHENLVFVGEGVSRRSLQAMSYAMDGISTQMLFCARVERERTGENT